MIPRCIFRCLLGAAALLPPVLGANEVPMQAKRVALFKNGYACVQMSGVLPQGQHVQVKGMPMPIFGTLDWETPPGVEVQEWQARCVPGQENSQYLDSLLRANEGRELVLTLDNKRVLRGTLQMLAPRQPAPEGAFRAESFSGVRPEDASLSMVALRIPHEGLVCISVDHIVGIEVVGQPAQPPAAAPAAELELLLSASAEKQPLQLHFMACGLSWLPTYRLELQDDAPARLVGQVSVINRLLDLENVDLELITGQPALGEACITSPLVRLTGLSRFLQAVREGRDWLPDALRPGASASVYRAHSKAKSMGAMKNEARLCVDDSADAMQMAPMGDAAAESATQAEELTYYTIPGFSCKRGEVVERELFTLSVPCRHVYTCQVPDQRALQNMAHSGGPQADIWHCVRLSNEGTLPWSMGVVSCYAGGRFAARSTLPFTAAGQENLLRLSKTLEASVNCREVVESAGFGSRGQRDAQPGKYRGEVSLVNHSSHPMEVELCKEVIGVPDEASDAGQISVTPSYYGNAHSTIMWKLKLAPGEQKTCTYTYRYFND